MKIEKSELNLALCRQIGSKTIKLNLKMKYVKLMLPLFIGLLIPTFGHCQYSNPQTVDFKIIAQGTDSPLDNGSFVCSNKYFNLEIMSSEFRQKYQLDDKSLYKKAMLIEIFRRDEERKGIDKINLLNVKKYKGYLFIEYEIVNSDTENDDQEISPFLIAQIPKSGFPIKFIENGVELGEAAPLYINN